MSNGREIMQYSCVVDAIDRNILEILSADGRATYARIGAAVRLSVAAAKRRVDRMVADGVIQGFTVIVNPKVLGWPLEAHVQLFTNGATAFDQVRDDLVRIPEVVEAFTVTGRADTILRVVAADPEQLERVLAVLRALPYVQQTDTALKLSTVVRRPPGG
ncbi:MAG: Lrp/AsnC family transcriptional regulator [Knoellia sp.]